jgi:hypothetical protein
VLITVLTSSFDCIASHLSSDSQRLYSLRNARTTPMDRERPDQVYDFHDLEGSLPVLPPVDRGFSPHLQDQDAANVRHIYSRRRIWAR